MNEPDFRDVIEVIQLPCRVREERYWGVKSGGDAKMRRGESVTPRDKFIFTEKPLELVRGLLCSWPQNATEETLFWRLTAVCEVCPAPRACKSCCKQSSFSPRTPGSTHLALTLGTPPAHKQLTLNCISKGEPASLLLLLSD